MTDSVRVRRISDDDWDDIVALEAGAYTGLGLSEERAALESKVSASPATCFALVRGPRVAGYLLALPYPMFEFPDLSRREAAVAVPSRNLHLHDLVIAQDLRGRGFGRRLLRHLTARARQQGYEHISLVAVGGSDTFWSANGFADRRDDVNAQTYGATSVYMSMALLPEPIGTPTAGRAPGGAPPLTK